MKGIGCKLLGLITVLSTLFFSTFTPSSTMADDLADVAAIGIRLYKEGRYEKGLEKLKKAKRLSPMDTRIDYNLGNINYQLGRFKKARKNWQNVLIKSGRLELRQKAYYNTGNAFYREDRYQEAIEHYKKALQIDRKDYATKFNLKLSLHKLRLQKKMKGSKNSPQDRKEQEAVNDMLKQRKQSDKRNSNQPKERIREASFQSVRAYQGGKKKDSYHDKLSINAAKAYLKTLKEGKYKYRSIFAEGSTNRRYSMQNDW